MTLTQHYLSAAYPAMQAHEYQALLDSISDIGVQHPITVFEGQVIDGWHRYKAANELGMDCPTIELGDVDPIDFAKSQGARRNITASQNALAITTIYAWRPRGDQRSAVTADREKTTKELAAIAGVGTRTIEQAKTVKAKAVPAVQDAVKSGAVSVETAAAIAKMPGKDQKKIAAKGPDAMRAAAKPAVAKPAHIEPEDRDYTGPSDAELLATQETAKAALSEAHEAVGILTEENERLNDRLAVDAMDASEEEKALCSETIASLRAQNKTLSAELKSVKASRDEYMRENGELKKQIKSQRAQLDKLKA